MLYTVNLREYKNLDTPWAPVGGIFQNHQDYAEWYATWWAYRIMDVIESYDPDFIYTDGDSLNPFTGSKSGTGAKSDAASRIVAHFYNRTLQRHGKVDTFSVIKFRPPTKGIVNTTEGGFPEDIKRDQPWLSEVPVGDWFYKPDIRYDTRSLIFYMLESVSRDGATAICIPIRPDGSLDAECERMLREVGAWMAINGEGIYGSQAWDRFGEGDIVDGKLKVSVHGNLGARQIALPFSHRDFRFTKGKSGEVYAFFLTVPEPGTQLVIFSLGLDKARRISTVELLGHDDKIDWNQERDKLEITMPGAGAWKFSVAFKVTILNA